MKDAVFVSAAFLAELGFYPQHSGFGYLACAIAIVAEEPMAYYSGRISVLAKLGAAYGLSAVNLRKCMNYSIRTAWDAPGNGRLRSIFPGCSENCPPSLFEFICRAAIEFSIRRGNEKPAAER